MKVYTEDQVRKAIELSRDTHPEGRGYMQREEYDYSMDEVINKLTPTELPSDEEIKKTMMDFDEFDPDDVAYLGGAIWMRDKIQEGNK